MSRWVIVLLVIVRVGNCPTLSQTIANVPFKCDSVRRTVASIRALYSQAVLWYSQNGCL